MALITAIKSWDFARAGGFLIRWFKKQICVNKKFKP